MRCGTRAPRVPGMTMTTATRERWKHRRADVAHAWRLFASAPSALAPASVAVLVVSVLVTLVLHVRDASRRMSSRT